MLSFLLSRGWIKPYGQMGWLDVCLIGAGVLLSALLRPASGDWGWS